MQRLHAPISEHDFTLTLAMIMSGLDKEVPPYSHFSNRNYLYGMAHILVGLHLM